MRFVVDSNQRQFLVEPQVYGKSKTFAHVQMCYPSAQGWARDRDVSVSRAVVSVSISTFQVSSPLLLTLFDLF